MVLKKRDPAVQKLVQTLQERIEQGGYPAGTWLPAERALSTEFAMDRSAVRAALKILQEHGLIVRTYGQRPWVNDKVGPALSTEPDFSRSAGLQTITVILPHHTQFPSALDILRGINVALRLSEAPYRLIVMDNHHWAGIGDAGLEGAALETAAEEGSAGLILWHMPYQDTLSQIQALRERDLPIVFIDRYPPEIDGDFVGVDNRAAAREAVEYMLNLGHTRIAHLSANEEATTVLERRAGYEEALRLRGLPVDEKLIHINTFRDDCISAADTLLNLDEPPTAVFAVNDYTAHAFIAELEQRGLRVPEDMSIIGFDDVDRYSARPALLTTVRQPFELIGQRATELLLRRLAEGSQTHRSWQHLLLPTLLQVRATCSERSAQQAAGRCLRRQYRRLEELPPVL